MTGPEPGDLAEITWNPSDSGERTDLVVVRDGYYRLLDLPGAPQGLLDDADILSVRPLSVVPTDSLEALADAVEKYLIEQAEPWTYADGLARDAALRAAAQAGAFIRAAVRSAITKPTTED